jgi:hypothetical protein
MWLGNGFNAGNAYFSVPPENVRDFASGVFDEQTGLVKFRNVNWFTNIDHARRHQPLQLMTMAENLKHNKKMQSRDAYDKYDNYDAIEVPFSDAIPSDYNGVMGVPISFLDKYSPEQFEIVGHPQSNILPKGWRGVTKEFVDLYYKQGNKGAIRQGWINPVYMDADGKAIVPYQRILIRHRKAAV